MTLIGVTKTQPFRVKIEAGPTDNWLEVCRISGSAMPGGTGSWAFVVFGTFGYFENVLGTNRTRCDVALGDQTGPFTDAFSHLPFNAASFYLDGRGAPFIFVRTYDTVLPASGARGQWNTSNSLVLWARVFKNGDSPSTVAGNFKVANVTMLAFRLNSLGTNQWFGDRYLPSSPANNGVGSYVNHYLSSGVGVFDASARDWLLFTSTQYQPGNLGTADYESIVCPTGLFASAVAVIGGAGKMGSQRHGERLDNFLNQGAARVFTTSTTTTQIGVRGKDYNSSSGNTSQIWKWEAFAIRTDALGYFEFANESAPTIYNEFLNNPISYEPLEATRSYIADLNVLITSCFDNTVIPGQTRSFTPYLHSNGQGSYHRIAELGTFTSQYQEGQHGMLLEQFKNVPRDVIQFRAAWLRTVNEGLGLTGTYTGADFTICQWIWENAPNTDGYNVPIIGATVAIDPGREALALGSLTELPFTPQAFYEFSAETVRHGFYAPTGEHITWPKFLIARRIVQLEWVLTDTERDTLFAFFAAQGRRAMKWTQPRAAAATPIVLLGRPNSGDLGLKQQVTASFAELVYIGGS